MNPISDSISRCKLAIAGGFGLVLFLTLQAIGQDGLTQEQVKAFRDYHERLGLAPGAETAGGPMDSSRGLVVSPDPTGSHLPVNIVQVNSVAELKRLVGISDADYVSGKISDRGIDYPRLPSGIDLHSADVTERFAAGTPLRSLLGKSMHAFLIGQSTRLRPAEPLIDAIEFPMALASVSTLQALVVRAGAPVVIKGPGPVVLNFGSITLDPGAQLVIETDTYMNVQILDVAGKATIVTTGVAGRDGTPGKDGASGAAAGTGGNGAPGGSGGHGIDGPNLVLRADEISGGGELTIRYGGGKGGEGGAGGKGRLAGRGGAGGDGGNGGDGGSVAIFYKSTDGTRVTSVQAGGQGGASGAGGDPGEPGNGAGGSSLRKGKDGLPGAIGADRGSVGLFPGS